jgi:DNA-binding MarR family transcriptional regulator
MRNWRVPRTRRQERLHYYRRGLHSDDTYTYHFAGNMTEGQKNSMPMPIDAPARRRLPPLLRRAWYGLNQAFRRRILHLGVTPDQFTVMRTVMEGDPTGLTQREIAEIISSDPNTIASLLERMEVNGLVERTAHEIDRRALRIRLLPKGRRVYKLVRSVALQLQGEILSHLPEQQRELFLENLAVVADACNQVAGQSLKRGDSKPKGSNVNADVSSSSAD